MLNPVLTSAAVLVSLAGPALGQEILGIDFGYGEVFRVDAKTGGTTYIGYTGIDQYLWHSMAKDSQGRIFAGYGRFDVPYAIYEIDPTTGQATLVVQTDRINLLGLAFGPGDQLYAVHEPLNHSRPSEIYTVDLITGTTTLIGSTGFIAVQGLAYGQGSLWGWDLAAGLVKIDLITGVASDVNLDIGDNNGLVQTICFSDDDVLYAGWYSLFTVDTSTGALSYIDILNPFVPSIAGVEFLPNQPAPFSLGVSGETGGPMGAFVAGATPVGNVAFFATRGGGGPTQILPGHACAGLTIDLNSRLQLIGLVQADAAGKAEIGLVQVPFYPTGALRLQALDLTTCATSNRARVVY